MSGNDITLFMALERREERWHTRTSGTDSDQAFRDRKILADEVFRLRQALADTEDSLREAEREVANLEASMPDYE